MYAAVCSSCPNSYKLGKCYLDLASLGGKKRSTIPHLPLLGRSVAPLARMTYQLQPFLPSPITSLGPATSASHKDPSSSRPGPCSAGGQETSSPPAESTGVVLFRTPPHLWLLASAWQERQQLPNPSLRSQATRRQPQDLPTNPHISHPNAPG